MPVHTFLPIEPAQHLLHQRGPLVRAAMAAPLVLHRQAQRGPAHEELPDALLEGGPVLGAKDVRADNGARSQVHVARAQMSILCEYVCAQKLRPGDFNRSALSQGSALTYVICVD